MTAWMTLQMQAADLLEDERERQGLSIAAWEIKIGVHPNVYDYFRSCKRPVGLAVLCRMFDGAGLDVGLILRPERMAAE